MAAKAVKGSEEKAERQRKEHMDELKEILRRSKTRCNCATAHSFHKPECKMCAFTESSCIQVESWAPAWLTPTCCSRS